MKKIIEKWGPLNGRTINMRTHLISTESGQAQEVVMRSHDECEITIMIGGNGRRFIGNDITTFNGTDIFMIGPCVPHCVLKDKGESVQAFTIHFFVSAFGESFFELPESANILSLLNDMQRGVTFNNLNIEEFVNKVQKLDLLDGFDRLIEFLKFLNDLALLKDRNLISSRGFSKVELSKDYILVTKTYEYILSRFRDENISLEELSGNVNMSTSSFCRFFKKHFNSTYTNFLNEVRVGYACKLLQDTDKNISQIAIDSGYNHLSHFNRQFKKSLGFSPKKYRHELS